MIRGNSKVPGAVLKQVREENGWNQEEIGKQLRPRRFRQYISLCEKAQFLPIKLVKDLDKLFGGDKWRRNAHGLADVVNDLVRQMREVIARLNALEGVRQSGNHPRRKVVNIRTSDN